MKRAALAAGLLALAMARPARAEETFDARMPVRAGFAFTDISNGPAFSFSWAIEADIARITHHLHLTALFDFDAETRLDLSDQDPISSFGAIGAGLGLFYVTEGSVGIGIDTAFSVTFDAKDLAGGGLMARAYLIPYYVPLSEAVRSHRDRFGAWVRSSLSLWAMARVDFTRDGNGGTYAFGGAIDLMRVLFLPYIELLTKKL